MKKYCSWVSERVVTGKKNKGLLRFMIVKRLEKGMAIVLNFGRKNVC